MGTRADKLLIGLGMIPRGEVGLIFASIGLTNGVLDGDQYGALLIVVLLTRRSNRKSGGGAAGRCAFPPETRSISSPRYTKSG